MDLGISGKIAVVCASSKGLGRGCALALAEAGVDLVLNARGAEALENTAQEIRVRYNVNVQTVAADITTQDGQDSVLDAAGMPDILVNNAGGPPPGMWSDWQRDDFLAALDANMLTPIALMTRVLPSMIEKKMGSCRQYYISIREGPHCGTWSVQLCSRRTDRLCGRDSTASCAAWREYQQSSSRGSCN